MNNERNKMNKPQLTDEDWVEIYYALDTKLVKVHQGDYGDTPDEILRWSTHLQAILEKIGPDGSHMIDDE